MNCNTIDEYLWKVELYLMKKFGCDRAKQDIAPLVWYIRTGRAPSAWLRLLMEKWPYNVAKILHNGGSYAEALTRVDEYIGWREYIRKDAEEWGKAKAELEAMLP